MTLLRRGELDQDATMACPRDGAPLSKLERDGVLVDRCASCKGVWFDEGELRRVAHDREVARHASRVGEVPVSSGFACPRCAGSCVGSWVAQVSVDTCTSCHGVWLDAGELEEAKRQIEVNRALAGQGAGFRDFLARL